MKYLLILLIGTPIFLLSCSDDEPAEDTTGTLELNFTNLVGSESIILAEDGVTEYPHTTLMGQDFNIVLLRYYISQIRLEGQSGLIHQDPQEIGPDPDDIKGIYLVQESDPFSHTIELSEIPKGEYESITVLIGVDSTGIEEGAAGGILDPGADAWFWNWNAGYVALGIEGQSPDATGDESARTLRPGNENGFGFHVGGWKDVPGSMFVYNNKELTFTFAEPISIGNGSMHEAELTLDVAELLRGIDFSTTSALHSPLAGSAVSDNIPEAFKLRSVN